MQRQLFLVVVLLGLIGNLFAQADKVNIAVNDLVGKNIEKGTAGIISDRIRSELINTGVFRVMERSEMEKVLKEQGFQQSGACNDAGCIVEVGQLLGVEKMVAGSVGKISKSLYTLDLRVIMVGTGEILYSVSGNHKGDIEGLLTDALKKVVRKLSDSSKGKTLNLETSEKKETKQESKNKVKLTNENDTKKSRRKKNKIGISIMIPGLAIAAGGGILYYLGKKDHDDAEDIKDKLASSSIQSGEEYDKDVQENSDLVSSGNAKKSIAAAMWGVGGIAAGIGIILQF